MMTGSILLLVGPLIYGKITLGRAYFTLVFIIATRLGIYFEEKDLQKEMKDKWVEYAKSVPNVILPNLKMLMMSSIQYDNKKKNILK